MKWLKTTIWIVLGLAGLFCFFLIMISLTDYRPVPVEKLQAGGNARQISESDSTFSIVTWNIGYFGLGKDCDFFYDGGKMTKPAKADYLKYSSQAIKYLGRVQKSDFYFFQEVDLNSARSYNDDQVDKIRGIFPGYESTVAINYKVLFVPMPLRKPMGKVKSGLLSISAFSSSENSRYAFPGGYSWPTQLFMLDRCFLLKRIPLPAGKDLVLINTHNEAFDDGSHRKKQLALLSDLMLAEYAAGNYVITGGDWNQNPVRFRDLEIGGVEDLGIWKFSNGDVGREIEPAIEPDFFPEGWQWVFDPQSPTNRDVNQPYTKGKTPTTIIDFFVVSPNISVVEIKTDDLGFEWSDHQPVRMVFTTLGVSDFEHP
jgi:endonuclease/exonuclease/phosphatase family metal-dependent hydrolase